jgi:hypothetical protein
MVDDRLRRVHEQAAAFDIAMKTSNDFRSAGLAPVGRYQAQ